VLLKLEKKKLGLSGNLVNENNKLEIKLRDQKVHDGIMKRKIEMNNDNNDNIECNNNYNNKKFKLNNDEKLNKNELVLKIKNNIDNNNTIPDHDDDDGYNMKSTITTIVDMNRFGDENNIKIPKGILV
jgi:hypothetical protein